MIWDNLKSYDAIVKFREKMKTLGNFGPFLDFEQGEDDTNQLDILSLGLDLFRRLDLAEID